MCSGGRKHHQQEAWGCKVWQRSGEPRKSMEQGLSCLVGCAHTFHRRPSVDTLGIWVGVVFPFWVTGSRVWKGGSDVWELRLLGSGQLRGESYVPQKLTRKTWKTWQLGVKEEIQDVDVKMLIQDVLCFWTPKMPLNLRLSFVLTSYTYEPLKSPLVFWFCQLTIQPEHWSDSVYISLLYI